MPEKILFVEEELDSIDDIYEHVWNWDSDDNYTVTTSCLSK